MPPADHENSGVTAALDEQEQGALDMLLKSHYEPVPPEGYFDSFLASVEQKIEEGLDGQGETAAGAAGAASSGKAGSSNGATEDDVFFKSSPALEGLRIPEPRRGKRTTGMLSVPTEVAAQPAEAPPPEPAGGYRWPVAFVLVAVIGVGGFLVYTKSEKNRQRQPTGPAIAARGASPAKTPGEKPAVKTPAPDAMALASAKTMGDAGAGAASDPTPTAPTKDDPAASTAGASKKLAKLSGKAARRRRKAGKSGKAAKAAPGKPAAKAKPVAVAKAAKAKAKPSKAKGKGDLDSLLDSALGGKAPAKPTKKAAAPKPAGPTTLSMNQIRASMRKLNSRVGACYDKYQVEGTARVKMTITRAGKPTNIKIRGKFFGTDTGACVKKAVKGARFPKFTGKEPSITYPFRLSE